MSPRDTILATLKADSEEFWEDDGFGSVFVADIEELADVLVRRLTEEGFDLAHRYEVIYRNGTDPLYRRIATETLPESSTTAVSGPSGSSTPEEAQKATSSEDDLKALYPPPENGAWLIPDTPPGPVNWTGHLLEAPQAQRPAKTEH